MSVVELFNLTQKDWLLRKILPPENSVIKKAPGMFTYYAKGINEFPNKIQSFIETKKFPLRKRALKTFNQFKKEKELGSHTTISRRKLTFWGWVWHIRCSDFCPQQRLKPCRVYIKNTSRKWIKISHCREGDDWGILQMKTLFIIVTFYS